MSKAKMVLVSEAELQQLEKHIKKKCCTSALLICGRIRNNQSIKRKGFIRATWDKLMGNTKN